MGQGGSDAELGWEDAAVSARSSAAEALCNAAVGFAVSWTLTVLALGYSPANGLAVTAMFFVASFARAFIIREAFRKWGY